MHPVKDRRQPANLTNLDKEANSAIALSHVAIRGVDVGSLKTQRRRRAARQAVPTGATASSESDSYVNSIEQSTSLGKGRPVEYGSRRVARFSAQELHRHGVACTTRNITPSYSSPPNREPR